MVHTYLHRQRGPLPPPPSAEPGAYQEPRGRSSGSVLLATQFWLQTTIYAESLSQPGLLVSTLQHTIPPAEIGTHTP